jgi:hypothetical protein
MKQMTLKISISFEGWTGEEELAITVYVVLYASLFTRNR